MRIPQIILLIGVCAVAAGLRRAPSRESRVPAQDQVYAQLREIHEASAITAEFFTPDYYIRSILEGQTGSVVLEQLSGNEKFVAAGCDNSCDDIDLEVQDAAGAVLGTDNDDDATPVVSLRAPSSFVRVQIRMRKCRSTNKVCSAGFLLLQRAVKSGAPSTSAGELVSIPASREATYSSPASDVSTQIRFVNSRPGRIQVYWLDFTGRRVHFQNLEPGQAYDQQTYSSHAWVVTDERGQGLAVFVALAQPNKAVVR
jgi:hypothetical protein